MMLSEIVFFIPEMIAPPCPFISCLIILKPFFLVSSIVPSVEPPSTTNISSTHSFLILGKKLMNILMNVKIVKFYYVHVMSGIGKQQHILQKKFVK